MEKKTENKPVCKSVFKNGKEHPSEKKCTQAWITLINKIEKNK